MNARHIYGDDAAIFAYAFEIRAANPSQASSRQRMAALLLLVAPDFGDPAELAERLSKERAAYKSSFRSAVAQVERSEADRKREWAALLARAGGIARRAFRRRRYRWTQQEAQRAEQSGAAVDSIRQIERSYREFMQLRAPVEYWSNKATGHATAESNALSRLKWYFPVAAVLVAAVFAGTASYLISHGGKALPPTIYFISSGALIVLSGLVLWVGRLLTKLYLSEHHLRHDAEERAVMTTTYLALIEHGGASEEERHLILSALFRSTKDGIVKEDGPPDLNVAALLARMGAK